MANWLERVLTSDRHLSALLPGALLLRWRHEICLGRTADLAHPRTFNEKLNWLKLRWRDPRMPVCADKLAVRDFVATRCGPEVLNELHRVWERAEDIEFAGLPDAFVLKATHGSGFNILCPDRSKLDLEEVRTRFRRWMRRDFGRLDREWHYRCIPRRILCERWLGDREHPPEDYKIFCFAGEPRLVEVHTKRGADHCMALHDVDWNLLPVLLEHPPPVEPTPRPAELPELLLRARQLSDGFPFVRVDLYVVERRVVFGEMTFFPTAGLKVFGDPADDAWMGGLLRLPDPDSPRRADGRRPMR